jgi:hypothetical protein
MLPERLSNDLCSLVPFQTRLCLVADLVIDGEGQTRQAELYPAVMRSAARCTYDQVASSLAGNAVPLPEAVVSRFPTMAALADRLSKMRRARGALDFNLPEGKIVLGPNGDVVDVVRDGGQQPEPGVMEVGAEAARQGGLPLTYHLGEGPAKLHLEVEWRPLGMPDQPLVENLGSGIARPPAVDRSGIEIHNPVLRNADLLKAAAFDRAVGPRSGGREDFDDQHRIGDDRAPY